MARGPSAGILACSNMVPHVVKHASSERALLLVPDSQHGHRLSPTPGAVPLLRVARSRSLRAMPKYSEMSGRAENLPGHKALDKYDLPEWCAHPLKEPAAQPNMLIFPGEQTHYAGTLAADSLKQFCRSTSPPRRGMKGCTLYPKPCKHVLISGCWLPARACPSCRMLGHV